MKSTTHLYVDEKGIGRAAVSLGDSKIEVYGDARFLPLPLGEGLGMLGKFDLGDTEQSLPLRHFPSLHPGDNLGELPKV